MFLIGVFLTDNEPNGNGPNSLHTNSRDHGNDVDIHPGVGQPFVIGNGKTFDQAQSRNIFVPGSATRLFLGFADAYGFTGPPGAYGDNSGFLQVNVFPPSAVPEPGTVALLLGGLGILATLARRKK